MIKIAVVDDDRIILKKISALIEDSFSEPNELFSFDSGLKFFNDPEKASFDVIFLDIDMPEINGFDIAKNLKTIKSNVVIIFVSSMEHLVFDSIKFSPFRFVRKNDLESDIKSAISDYEIKLHEDRKTYFLKTNEIEAMIQLNDIMYFESVGHDIYVQTAKNKFKLKRSKDDEHNIKAIHEKLSETGFIRIHKSYLVNYKFIYAFKRNQVILKDNTTLDMNPHNAAEIKKVYNRFLIMED